MILVWSTENPSGITIDPEIGPVAARGTKQIKPTVTTTYTLTLRGGPSKTVTVTVAGTTAVNNSAASAANTAKRDPRMPDGKPDLSGVYSFAGLPAGHSDAGFEAGRRESIRIVRGPNDVRGRTTLGTDCKPLGVPQTYITPYPFQIVQTPKLLVDHLRIPEHVSDDSDRRPSASRRPRSDMDGELGRALGGRHAGG